MPAVAVSGDPSVVVVDVMELRRALVVHFLKDWAAAENVEIFSFAPNDAHQALREGIDCRMIIFNAGAALCSSADTLAEVKVLRVLAPSASLVFLADEEIPEEVVTVMRSGAEGYLSNGSSPDAIPPATALSSMPPYVCLVLARLGIQNLSSPSFLVYAVRCTP